MRSLALTTLGAFVTLSTLVQAQDGGLSGPTSSLAAAGYSCDPSQCQLPKCRCASTDIPGNIPRDQTPMFLVFTADDAVQSYTINAVNNILAHRKNPNGCAPKMTYYTQILYTNYTLVTDWYVAGNEIADHTMTHPNLGGPDEINGNLFALNALAGIPMSKIPGYRAPYLNYSAELLTNVYKSGFQYDSSATASSPVDSKETDAWWPYTLDNGLANDCLTFPDVCKGEPKLPGFWEVPLYAIFDDKGAEGIHLMDPWLDGSTSDVENWMKTTFTAHYNAQKQPFGLYTHPIHIATGYPGVADPTATINMINDFVDWATKNHDNVWIVSHAQLLDWVRNPLPASRMNEIKSFGCSVPVVDAKICNGMHPNEDSLIQNCGFSDTPFSTCYGCPVTPPSPANPNPSQSPISGKTRTRLPDNCDTPFWDPVGAKCLCQEDSCQFNDQTRPIGGDGGNNTSGGGTSSTTGSSSPSSTTTKKSDGAAVRSVGVSGGVLAGIVLGFIGVIFGAASTVVA